MSHTWHSKKTEKCSASDARLKIVAILFILLALFIIYRLVVLMIFQHNFYLVMAADSHDVSTQLIPKRGQVYLQDTRTHEEYPLAMNRDYFLIFADTRDIKDDGTAQDATNKLAQIFNYDQIKSAELFAKLNRRTVAYFPIEKKVEEDVMQKIKELNLPGIGIVRVPYRYYPEGRLGSNVIGFLGKNENGGDVGRYGIESYWQEELSGSKGYLSGAKSAIGGIIPLTDWTTQPAVDGADLLLTIDRTLEDKTCERLRQAQAEYQAKSAALIIMEPQTGAIRVMCSSPDFDPNNYSQVTSPSAFNNDVIFTPYEAGSVFKAITMAAGLNEGAVTPETTFVDTGVRADLCKTTIRNAQDKTYGRQNMSSILENSINTGAVFVAEKLGKTKFVDYVKKFGFGVKEGVDVDIEAAGNISTLNEKKGDRVDCYAATASFGQGITVTPLQLVNAYSAIANGGNLMKPFVVDKVRYSDGRVEKTKPKIIRQVVDKKAAMLTMAMLINVVDKGHAQKAKVKGYYIGGKTGTAQIPVPGGYSDDSIQTFIGIAPADDPKFVMLIKFEKPQVTWADSTTAPLFGELADFILKYYQIPPTR